MEKIRRPGGTAIITVVIMCLVVGWVTTLAHYNNVVREKDDKIEMLTLQVLQVQGERKQALDDLKICQDKVDDFMYVWWNIRKVRLSDSKYYVGISEDDFWMLVDEVDELNKLDQPD